ncbi:MAG: alpha/beta hydrolase [Armatimonadota bacterium]|nr:alpha/beta hydrolase [Armatimonadota bacterium]
MSRTKALYIPGWAAGRDSDREFVAQLGERFDVETLWLPEYGDHYWEPSQPAEHIYLPEVSKRVAKEVSPVVLIGWSIGGMVAMEAAAACPEHVKALVLVSTTVKFHLEPLENLISQLISQPEQALRNFFLSAYYPVRPDKAELAARVRTALDAGLERLLLGLEYLWRADLRGITNSINTPTLILHGCKDAVIPVEAVDDLRASLPKAKSHIFENAGHMLPSLYASEICSMIPDILRKLP